MENKAKVKAEELIKKIKHVTMSWNIQEECYDASLEDQVKAAIIAVEEIIKTIDNGKNFFICDFTESKINHLHEVQNLIKVILRKELEVNL